MTFSQILTTVFEILMVFALFWCFFHEDRLIAFERRLLAGFKHRKFKVIRSSCSNSYTVRQ